MSFIKGISSAFPEYFYKQEDIIKLGRSLFSNNPNFNKMTKVYDNSGVKSRFLVNNIDWYKENHNWKERNFLFKKNSISLLEKSIYSTLKKSFLKANQIGAIILVNTTGLATPSIDAELINLFNFASDIRRLPIFGFGCAGGVLGLNRGVEIQKSIKKPVLVCNVELCSLTFRPQILSKENIISTALFGDGASSYVIDHDGECKVLKSIDYTWKNSLDLMGWSVENDGLGVIFDKEIPKFIEDQLLKIVLKFFSINDKGFVLHSGGMKIINAYKKIFKNHYTIKFSEEILSNYGNVSSVSVLLVLKKIIENNIKGNFIMSAMGPGFSAGISELEINA